MLKIFLLFHTLTFSLFVSILAEEETPKVLCVIAHPDDEIAFAATIYKITHELNGLVDICILTNGEGGFRYGLFANAIYQIEITNEKIGRKYLPFIRKQEALNAGKILGVHNYFFLDQSDFGFTKDIQKTLACWNTTLIKNTLLDHLQKENYNLVFTLLPHAETHGHHQAATLLALQVLSNMEPQRRPIILAADTPNNEAAKPFVETLPLMQMKDKHPLFELDKMAPIGFEGKLNYQIIVNWVIAEYKSQGYLQLLMNKGDKEKFYYFALNGDEKIPYTQNLFKRLSYSHK